MDIKSELFNGKSLADLFTEIHKNTEDKRAQINTFILKMVQLIRTPEDVVMLGPVIQGFIEANIKNDEHLVRVAQISQRLMSIGNKAKDSLDSLLTEDEKQALLEDISVEIKELQSNAEDINSFVENNK